ncbi:MAG: hypothetical protein ACOYXW_02615 [Actinomycetota bacterium]
MNALVDIVITAIPFAVGGWAAWYLPRWAGEDRSRGSSTTEPEDWTPATPPSRPYRDLHRVS